MKRQRWQDWVNAALGLWIFLSPWAVPHQMTTGQLGMTSVVMWNMYIVGIVIALVAIAAIKAFQTWQEWTNLVLGGWLLISPWVFGFTEATAFTWNAVLSGLIVVILAGWAISTAKRGELSPL